MFVGLKINASKAHQIKCISLRNIGSVVSKPDLFDFTVANEPIYEYRKNSKEREELRDALKKLEVNIEDIPIVIGGKEIRTKDVRKITMPHKHSAEIAKFYHADKAILEKAIQKCVETQPSWDRTPLKDRIQIWDRAADLAAGKYRQELNAATMMGQSKTVIQAEIDSAAELVDFIRFNAYFLKEHTKYQPISTNPKVTKNSMRFRGIDGFCAAISPFNFTAIGGNLAYTPALMGNAVLWKPSHAAVLSNWIIFKIMREAGVPPGVVNFVPCEGPLFGNTITASPHLAGINFTGSVPTFKHIWKQVGENIALYNNFPRLVGECGGKNYHFVHPSADVETVVASSIRSAFEYCGQKCSALSRMYIPESLWPKIQDGLLKHRSKLKMGDPREFDTFMGAVIDATAFKRIKLCIDNAKQSKTVKLLGGGKCEDKKGYFIEPTILQVEDPLDKLMMEEIFGPVLSCYVYKDTDIERAINLVSSSTKFALTGSVFAQDEMFLRRVLTDFKMSAGNFYINDKSTGAVVGQQPFGGGRISGTNDKAGGPHYVLRWTTPQIIKETFVPMKDVSYPYMDDSIGAITIIKK